jgi:type III pantothenate kinase
MIVASFLFILHPSSFPFMDPGEMHRQLLAIDAGNSRLKFGLFVPSRSLFYRRNGTAVNRIAVVDVWPNCRRFVAVPADDEIPWSTLAGWQAEGAVVAGSNPRAVERVLEQWATAKIPAPIVVKDYSSISLSIDVESPEKVGLDRLLNAVAANRLRPPMSPAIVIDSGTATTVNSISVDGVFQGGAILPGLEMSAKALNHYTAVLPLLPVQQLGGEDGNLPVMPGRNTREAIRNGLFWGQVGAIRELVRQTCHQQQLSEPDFSGDTNEPNSPWMILTGGGGPVLSSQFPGILFIPSLGMHGLVLTAWQNED